MHMIGYGVDGRCRGIEVSEYPGHVRMQARANGIINDSFPAFGAKDEVYQVFDEGLRHGDALVACALSGRFLVAG